MDRHGDNAPGDGRRKPQAGDRSSSELDRLLKILCDLDGSDLHIKGGSPHSVHVDGYLHTLESEPPISAEEALVMAEAIMAPNIREIFWDRHEADFAYSVNGVGRFRINAFYQRGSVALAIRQVRTSTSSIEELGLPEVVRRLADEQQRLDRGDRSHRLRQDDDAGGDDQPHQRDPCLSHRHRGGPHRVPAQ